MAIVKPSVDAEGNALSPSSSLLKTTPGSEPFRDADSLKWSPLFSPASPSRVLFDVFVISLLIVALYGLNLDVLSVRGEESRRGRTAWEMIEYNDWIVPRLQGEPRLTRPPFSYWLIAMTIELTGHADAIAVRLPSVIAVFVTSLALYAYASYLINPSTGLLAAFAFMTQGQVLQLGRLGESEAIFTALLGSALLTAHIALRPTSSQTSMLFQLAVAALSGSLAALAMLTKGLQSPVYYFGTILIYLVVLAYFSSGAISMIRSRILTLVTLLTSFALTFSVWLIPFAQRLGPKGLYDITFEELAKHVTSVSSAQYLRHLIEFPIELVFACLIPWSLLLFAFFDTSFRTSFFRNTSSQGHAQRDAALFATIGFLIALPTVWIATDGNTRYLMPVYPLVAVLAAIVVSHLLTQPALAYLWRRFAIVLAGFIVAGFVITLGLMITQNDHHLEASPWNMLTLLSAPILLMLFWKSRNDVNAPSLALQLTLTSLMLVLLTHGTFLHALNYKRLHADNEVARVKSRLPHPDQLVSLGLIHHLFSFFYAQRIPMVTELPEGVNYFCFHHKGADKPLPDLGFPYALIATVNCDRKQRATPYDLVIIAQRDTDKTDHNPGPDLAYQDSGMWLHQNAFSDPLTVHTDQLSQSSEVQLR